MSYLSHQIDSHYRSPRSKGGGLERHPATWVYPARKRLVLAHVIIMRRNLEIGKERRGIQKKSVLIGEGTRESSTLYL